MIVPEPIALDTEFLKEMLLAHSSDLGKIRREFKSLYQNCSDELGKFLTIRRLGEDSKKYGMVIKKLSIMIAKNENKINTSEWEEKYEHAKERVSIEDVARHYLKVHDFRKRLKCIFHVSKDGGGKHLQIYPRTNSFHCFSCKASGNPVDFVMKAENCDFKEAVNIMQYM